MIQHKHLLIWTDLVQRASRRAREASAVVAPTAFCGASCESCSTHTPTHRLPQSVDVIVTASRTERISQADILLHIILYRQQHVIQLGSKKWLSIRQLMILHAITCLSFNWPVLQGRILGLKSSYRTANFLTSLLLTKSFDISPCADDGFTARPACLLLSLILMSTNMTRKPSVGSRQISTQILSADWTQDTVRSPTLGPCASLSSQSIIVCELYRLSNLDPNWAHHSVLDHGWHLSNTVHVPIGMYLLHALLLLYLDKCSEAPKQPKCSHTSLDSGTSRSSFLVPLTSARYLLSRLRSLS